MTILHVPQGLMARRFRQERLCDKTIGLRGIETMIIDAIGDVSWYVLRGIRQMWSTDKTGKVAATAFSFCL
jgi:hypothetical protein